MSKGTNNKFKRQIKQMPCFKEVAGERGRTHKNNNQALYTPQQEITNSA